MYKPISVLCLVLVLVVRSLCVVNGQVTITVNWDNLYRPPERMTDPVYDSEEIFEVLPGQSLKITLQNVVAHKVQCRTQYLKEGITAIRGLDYMTLPVIDFPLIHYDMSTKWDCTAQKGAITLHIFFEIKVKAARPVHININHWNLFFTDTDLSVRNYDAIAEYFFEDGEYLNVSCRHLDERFTNMIIRYNNPFGNLLDEFNLTSYDKPLNFGTYITAQNNNSYIDCIISDVPDIAAKEFLNIKQNFTYRTILTLREPWGPFATSLTKELIITINDTIQYHKLYRKKDSELSYVYKFRTNDTLIISCKKNKQNTPGSVKFEHVIKFKVKSQDEQIQRYNSERKNIKVLVNTPSIKTLQLRVDNTYVKEEILKCFIANSGQVAVITLIPETEREVFVSTTPTIRKRSRGKMDSTTLPRNYSDYTPKATKPTPTTIYKKSPEKPPVILGLPATDVHSLHYISKDSEAVFMYSEGQSVTLTCVTENYRTPRWLYGELEGNGSVLIRESRNMLLQFDIPGARSISLTLNLTAQHNGSRIICESRNELNPSSSAHTAVIILQLKLIHDNSTDTGILIGCLAGIAAAAITAACVVFLYRKNINAKHTKNSFTNPVHANDNIPPVQASSNCTGYDYDYAYRKCDEDFVSPSPACPLHNGSHVSTRELYCASNGDSEYHIYTEIDENFINKGKAKCHKKSA